MTAYKGNSRKIKDALVTILSDLQYDSGDGPEPAFVAVVDNTVGSFDGYPVATVVPNELNSTVDTNTQNDHEVTFAVAMHFPLTSDGVPSTSFNQMLDYTDVVIDALEHGDYTEQLSQIDPSFYNWIMTVPASTWTIQGDKTGGELIAILKVSVTYAKDVY